MPVAGFFLLLSCRDGAGTAHDCTCSYLTDTDVPGEQAVEVCVPEGRSAAGAAAECVQGMGVGAVETCSCAPASRACEAGRCAERVTPGR